MASCEENRCLLLHFGDREYVLFSFWKMGSLLGLVASSLLVMLISILREAVIGLEFFLDNDKLEIDVELHQNINDKKMSSPTLAHYENTDNRTFHWSSEFADYFKDVFSKKRFIQALLHSFQWTLFFIIILVVVISNVWLILAAIFGKTLGHMVFTGAPGLKRLRRRVNSFIF